MPLIPLDHIEAPFPNPCTLPVAPESDARLLASIRKAGVLSAVLVRPGGKRFQLVFGYRRVRLAREAGLTEVPAIVRPMSDLAVMEAQVTENQHRRNMHPVDQWKAAADLMAAGESLPDAAVALGFTERETQRLAKLSALHPDLRELVIRDMPAMRELKHIAAAPPDKQKAALKAQYAVQGDRVNWHIIALACRGASIPKNRAIFDADTSGLAFMEDLFAQPGADDQFYTQDIPGFMRAQRAALDQMVADGKQKGERIIAAEWTGTGIRLPAGYARVFPDMASGRRFIRFVAICEDGPDIGKLVEVMAEPPAQIARPTASRGAPAPAAASVVAETRAGPGDDIERRPMTARGSQIIANAKTGALREHLRKHGGNLSEELLGACLVVALAADNVTVNADGTSYARTDFSDLAARLVGPGGDIAVDGVPVNEIMAEALARILVVTSPVTNRGSGKAAEWIGCALDAGMALPRFDTAEFLATLAKRELAIVAAGAGIDPPDKVTEMRDALVGKAPDFRPTTFGAPGPQPERAPQRLRQAEDALA